MNANHSKSNSLQEIIKYKTWIGREIFELSKEAQSCHMRGNING